MRPDPEAGELFRIETDRLLLVWGAGGGAPTTPAGRDPPPVVLHPRREGVQPRLHARNPPARLFEQTGYTLLVQSRTGEPVAVEHRDPLLLRALQPLDGGRIVHGPIDFGSQVGRTLFSLRVGGAAELDFEVEVFPSKLDYAQDYPRLLDDTREILSALVLEYLRATFRPGDARPAAGSSHLEWMLLLRHEMDELERALGQIARHPQRALSRDPQESRAERVVRPDPALRRAVQRGAGAGRGALLPGGLPVRERLVERRARPTLDTPEHRWLAAQLAHIRGRLARLREAEARRGGGERQARTLAELAALEQRAVRLSRLEPLAGATRPPPPGFVSLQLSSAAGYREAYRACLALSRGLGLEAGPLRLPLKELHLLYEYWCYLTLVRLLARLTGSPLPAGQLLAVEQNGLHLRLRRGREHAVVFRLGDGRRISATYNPRFRGEPLLVPQQPDVLLGVHHPGGPPLHAVLDAKYRLDASPAYLRRYGSPGPPEDALNTLHRYRDALVREGREGEPPRRIVAHALALYPWREGEPDAYRASRLWRSLARLGVGAVPLLPGSTQYLEEWLREIIAPAPPPRPGTQRASPPGSGAAAP